MKTNKIIQIAAMLCCIVFMASCEYEFIEPKPKQPIPVDTTPGYKISFAGKIAPIFTNDNCIQCHDGSYKFDLSPENAYNSIWDNGLVVAKDSINSIIYTYPHPEFGLHNKKYSSLAEADSIARWIMQGALNN